MEEVFLPAIVLDKPEPFVYSQRPNLACHLCLLVRSHDDGTPSHTPTRTRRITALHHRSNGGATTRGFRCTGGRRTRRSGTIGPETEDSLRGLPNGTLQRGLIMAPSGLSLQAEVSPKPIETSVARRVLD